MSCGLATHRSEFLTSHWRSASARAAWPPFKFRVERLSAGLRHRTSGYNSSAGICGLAAKRGDAGYRLWDLRAFFIVPVSAILQHGLQPKKGEVPAAANWFSFVRILFCLGVYDFLAEILGLSPRAIFLYLRCVHTPIVPVGLAGIWEVSSVFRKISLQDAKSRFAESDCSLGRLALMATADEVRTVVEGPIK